MPSYTSNSSKLSRRIPDIAWKSTFCWVAVIVISVFSFSEYSMRKAGFIPSVFDDFALWSLSREKVYNGKSVVLLGASRIMTGFDSAAYLSASNDTDAIFLAVNSFTNSLSTLKDLSDDDKFKGTAIVSIHINSFSKDTISQQNKHTQYYHNEWSLNKRLNRIFATAIQDNLVSIQSHLNISRILSKLAGDYKNFSFSPPFATTNNDRSVRANYKIHEDILRKLHEQRYQHALKSSKDDMIDKDGLISTIDLYNQYADKIADRGGQVIFLRMPSGECGELENNSPNTSWALSTIASRLNHIYIDAYQWPALASFPSADCSHLDYRDARHFTLQFTPIVSSIKNMIAKNQEQ